MENIFKILPRYRVIEANLDAKLKSKKGKFTKEEYVLNLKRHGVTSTIPDEEYEGCNTSIYHVCLIHNFRFKAQPSNIMNGYPCPLCNKEKVRISNEKSYKQKLKSKNINVILDGEYISHNEKVYHICLCCGNRWMTSPAYVLKNMFPCPECAKKITSKNKEKTQEQFKREVFDIFGNTLNVIGTYMGAREHIRVHCNLCEYDWNPIADSLLSKHGCPHCRDIATGNRCRKTKEQFVFELYKVNSYVKVLGNYIDSITPIKCECLSCGYNWYPRPANLLSGYGCPKCKKFSRGEIIIETFLIQNNISFISQKSFDGLKGIGKKPLSYDFYLPSYNFLIEYQGAQHELPVEYFGGKKKFIIQQIHDIRKRKYAKNNNIKLITIWYDQINDIPNILNNYLNNLKLESVTTTGVA